MQANVMTISIGNQKMVHLIRIRSSGTGFCSDWAVESKWGRDRFLSYTKKAAVNCLKS